MTVWDRECQRIAAQIHQQALNAALTGQQLRFRSSIKSLFPADKLTCIFMAALGRR